MTSRIDGAAPAREIQRELAGSWRRGLPRYNRPVGPALTEALFPGRGNQKTSARELAGYSVVSREPVGLRGVEGDPTRLNGLSPTAVGDHETDYGPGELVPPTAEASMRANATAELVPDAGSTVTRAGKLTEPGDHHQGCWVPKVRAIP